jgi:outer membrane protein assembly factor BamA
LKKKLVHIFLFLSFIALQACSLKGTLSDPLLYSQNFRGNKVISSETLEPLLPQKPNKKILKTPLTPGLYFYQLFAQKWPTQKIRWQSELTKLKEDYDLKTKNLDYSSEELAKLATKKEKKVQKLTRCINEGNWWMRTLGEAPSYFFEQDAEKNVEKIATYLKNHGFFNYKVSYKKDSIFFQRGSVAVTYLINEGVYYPIKRNDSLVIKDPLVREIIAKEYQKSKLKIGERLSLENYNAEKERIEQLLKNHGYYYFSKDNISIKINALDTAYTKGLGVVTYIPSPERTPKNPNYARPYPINSVQFISDGSSPSIPLPKIDTVENKGIRYFFVNKRYSPALLDTKIDIRAGQLYSQENVLETQKKLYGLEQFQFTRINFDTLKGNLNTTIYAKPLDKYEFSVETGGSVFAGGSLNKLVPGPFLSTSYKARNLGGSANSLETSFRFGFEAQAGFLRPDSVNRNLELGLNTSFILPEITLPNFIARAFDNYSPQTRITVGAELIGRQEYNRFGFKIGSNFTWKPSANQYWQVSLFDVNLINTSKQTVEFQEYLKTLESEGNNLGRSFRRSFISSMSTTYTYTDNPYGQLSNGKYLKLYFETSGTTLNLLPNHKIGFLRTLLGDSLQFYRYIKASADYRKYIPLSSKGKSLLAYRINTGFAYAYGDERELPYEKNFFIGGPNSLRAWRPRGLGPGSYSGSFDNPGSIILETSAEFRFKLIHFYGDLNAALFVDAGNVWRFAGQSTAGQTGSDFQVNRFYKEIAVGTGFGLRYDLSFFVIRFDWAIKVLDPAMKGNTWVLFKNNLTDPTNPNNAYQNPLTLNFGIGYPF